MLAVPSLTMPSSSAQDSWCVSWKYRSAKSTECASTSPNTRSRRRSSSPLGCRIRSRASASGSLPGVLTHGCSVREGTMRERGKAFAHAGLAGQVHFRDRTAAAARHALQNPSPVVDDHAVAVSLTSARMEARLRGRENITQILDRPRPQQGLPVRPPRGRGKRRGHHQQLRARGAQVPVQLREAHVVAHRKAEPARRGVHHGRGSSRGDVPRFAVRLDATGNINIEQVNLVVTGGTPAVGVVDERGGGDASVVPLRRAAARCRRRSTASSRRALSARKSCADPRRRLPRRRACRHP